MGVSRETFYDPGRLAIAPMGLCYPGTEKNGDLPPRPECAAAWRKLMMAQLTSVRLTLAIGAYAIAWHLPQEGRCVADAVKNWCEHTDVIALPHPSPRNNRWLRERPWFEAELVPELRKRVEAALAD